ncbi:MAG: alpha/beta hydrolase [Chloroflexi bacterium]|nr:alpha/beta hydrolase [Chloroflexota bacterium]MDA1001791.1 alpha/beta hydrolase [Chloroflexota bacterium]
MTDPTLPGVTSRFVEANGIRMRIAEAGTGPLVLLLHGFPESWYSWRHQLGALADAGYHVVAPAMRGYGESDSPPDVEDFDITHLVGDAAGLVEALGEERAVVVGHDWGAIIAWQCALLRPDRFRAVAGLSVPYTGRAPVAPVSAWRRRFGDNFFYILYFQQSDIAENEFDTNPRALLQRLYQSPGSPIAAPPEISDPLMSAGGWIGRLAEPAGLPAWLTAAELDYYVEQFERSGFRGPVNYYRNFDRNWELTPELAGAPVVQPAIFIAGEQDPVIVRGGIMGAGDDLEEHVRRAVPDLRGWLLVPGAGHWIQQERPGEVNAALIDFLEGLVD